MAHRTQADVDNVILLVTAEPVRTNTLKHPQKKFESQSHANEILIVVRVYPQLFLRHKLSILGLQSRFGDQTTKKTSSIKACPSKRDCSTVNTAINTKKRVNNSPRREVN